MTAFTLNSGLTVEWDSLAGGSVNATLDAYTISNNTTLRIAVDTYQCLNHSVAFGSLDTVASSGVGGILLFDATLVRCIPFTGGAGTVPAIGASIVQGGVSGPLLGIWANWQSEPLAAGAAMPATGFIKIKSKAGGNYAAGALTGVTASASGPDTTGWIEFRGADLATITANRFVSVKSIGDWFYLANTTGVRGQIIQCPTTATNTGVFSGMEVETGPATGIFEQWHGVGSMVNLATNPIDVRGKFFWHTVTGLRIGSDGVNNVGFLPPAGCRVRIPNIIGTCCTRTAAGSGIRVLPNATLATRQEFATTNAGAIDLAFFVCQWYANFTQAFSVKLRNCYFNDVLLLAEISQPLDAVKIIVAPTQAQVNTALSVISCFAGGTVQDALSVRFSAATNTFVNILSYINGVNFIDCKPVILTNRASTSSGTWGVTQAADCVFTRPKNIGGRMAFFGCLRSQVVDAQYADNIAGTTQTAQALYAFDISAGSSDITISGMNFFGLVNVHPRLGLVISSNSYRTKLRNIGTDAAPLNMGTVNPALIGFVGAGNNNNIAIQRMWLINTGTAPWSFVNSDTNVTIEQGNGDFADTPVVVSLNTLVKGIRSAGSATGQISVYGSHWGDYFTAATTGKIAITCNESTSSTTAQCFASGGSPKFSSSGQLALTVVGDQVTWEMPYFAKGHTALANLAPTLTGTTTGNLTYEFQYDKGAGYNGTWLILNAANFVIAGAINPSTGVRLKVKATCSIASAANLLANISIPTVTSTVDQNANLYPLDVTTITFTGLPTGCDVVVLSAGTETILASQDAGAGVTYSYTYETPTSIDIGFLKQGYVPFYIRNLALTSVDASIPVSLVVDRNFL
jgi:hypothetical protein